MPSWEYHPISGTGDTFGQWIRHPSTRKAWNRNHPNPCFFPSHRLLPLAAITLMYVSKQYASALFVYLCISVTRPTERLSVQSSIYEYESGTAPIDIVPSSISSRPSLLLRGRGHIHYLIQPDQRYIRKADAETERETDTNGSVFCAWFLSSIEQPTNLFLCD